MKSPRRKKRLRTGRSGSGKRRLVLAQGNGLHFQQLEDRRMLASVMVTNAFDLTNADTSSITALVANDGGDGISLREAILATNNTAGDDSITFDGTVFTGGANSLIRLTQGELEITETLTIDASMATDVTITGDANGDDVTLPGTFITDVDASFGGVSGAYSDLLNDNSRVIYVASSSGDLSLNRLTITGGRTIRRTTYGAGSQFYGGGILFAPQGILSLVDSSVSGNSTLGVNARGGGISSRSGSISVTNSEVSGNSTSGEDSFGGGINAFDGSIMLVNSSVSKNSTAGDNAKGGGISTRYADVHLTNSTIDENQTSGERAHGGGVYSRHGTVSLSDSVVSGNRTTDEFADGGGIYKWGGEIFLAGSAIIGNESGSNGGGVSALVGMFSATSSTISGNGSGRHGGGIFTRSGRVTLNDSTVFDNHAADSGGGIAVDPGNVSTFERLTIVNSIVAKNFHGQTESDFIAPAHGTNQLTVNHSLIGSSRQTGLGVSVGSPDADGNLVGSTSRPLDPLLAPLSTNGGITQTHALLPNSPAIDAGNSSLGVDQRGLTRQVDFLSVSNSLGSNGSDIGAFELQTLSSQFPSEIIVAANTISEVDLSSALVINESGGIATTTLIVVDGVFSIPADGSGVGDGVAATRVDPQTITLAGEVIDINSYLDGISNLHYTPVADVVGNDAATISVIVNTGGISSDFEISVNIQERASLLVTTATDVEDLFDGVTSLREAINYANLLPGESTVSFDPSVFTGGSDSVIRLTQGELVISSDLAIDGSTGSQIVISGDANGDDSLLEGTFITDVSASFGGTLGGGDDLLDDNSRLINLGSSGDLTLLSLTLTGGRTTGFNSSGGAVRVSSFFGGLSLVNSTVSGNSTIGGNADGGGIHAWRGDILVVDSTVSRNTSGDEGGGIYSREGGVSLVRSTVSENVSYANGGGVYSGAGNVSLTGSTVSGNVSYAAGGGIYSLQNSVVLDSSTVAGNQANRVGGISVSGISFDSNSVSNFVISNSIIAGNTESGVASDLRYTSGSTPSIDYSLIGVNSGTVLAAAPVASPDANGNLIGSVESPIDAQLSPLTNSGGPTQTHSLLPASPAIDAGNSTLVYDQRGLMRQIDFASISNGSGGNGADIGAIEIQTVGSFFPSDVLAVADTASFLDLTSAVVVDEEEGGAHVTLSVDAGEFSDPLDGSTVGDGVIATLIDSRTISLIGAAGDVNRYLDKRSNLQYTPTAGVLGDDVATINVTFAAGSDVSSFDINVDVGSLKVTTASDVFDLLDGVTSLREAVSFANRRSGNDTITFDSSVFTGGANSLVRLELGELEITETLAIDGSTATDVTIDAEGRSRLLNFTFFAGDLNLSGLTLVGGNTSATDTPRSGGGIRFSANGILSLTSSTVTGNTSGSNGGGIYTSNGMVALVESAVVGNSSSSRGGGIYTESGEISLLHSSVRGNATTSDYAEGGGIFTYAGQVSLDNSEVAENATQGFGSGGGGIFTSAGSVFINESTVNGNTTVIGAYVSNSSSDGGGIHTHSGAVYLTNSTVSGNSSASDGGGVRTATGDIVLTNSTVSGNTVRPFFGRGGGIITAEGAVSLMNTTITLNQGAGGGIAFDPDNLSSDSMLTVENSIVAGNTTSRSSSSTTRSPNDILASAEGADRLLVNHSLIGVNVATSLVAAPLGSPDANGNLIGTSANPINPLLLPLADNGGQTQTHSLVSNSPAIDAGNSSLGTDQRGLARQIDFASVNNSFGGDGSDIGAFELQTLNAVLPSDLLVVADATSSVDFSSVVIGENNDDTANVTFNAAEGTFAAPADGSSVGAGVTATLLDSQTVTLVGAAVDINGYLDDPSVLRYTPAVGAVGLNATTMSVNVDTGNVQSDFIVRIDIREQESLQVNTKTDDVDPFDGLTSLREAVDVANSWTGPDTITFDSNVFSDASSNGVIRLAQGELRITEALTIDGSAAEDLVISGDALGDDRLLSGTFITDVAASFGGTSGATSDRLNDNSRVINFLGTTGTLQLNDLTVTGGRTLNESVHGAGITSFSGNITLTNTLVSGNSTFGDDSKGGGIQTYSGDVSLNNSTVSGNSTNGAYSSGGGILTSSGDVALANSTVSGNYTLGNDSDGGGIFTWTGIVSVSNSTVSENYTLGDYSEGGGAFSSFGDVSLVNSTVSGNVTFGNEGYGGGIFSFGGEVSLTNSTLSGNSTSGFDADGGGLFAVESNVLLVNSTVAENSASGVGGGIGRRSGVGALTVINSIAAGNSDNGTAPDLFGPNLVSDLVVEHSLIGVPTGSGITLVTGAGNILNEPALLGPLADNGGSTLTHELLPGSPAIDAGSEEILVDQGFALTSDQRGRFFVRSFDDPDTAGTGIDIGAFERQPFTLIVDSVVDENDGDLSEGDVSLREAIEVANSVSGVETIIFDENVFTGGANSLIRLTQGELEITDSVTIDASSVSDVTITGDANGDDVTLPGTFITNVEASFGDDLFAEDDLLDDNFRLINFSGETGDLTLRGLTLTGGRSAASVRFDIFRRPFGPEDADGGGVRFASSGTLLLDRSSVLGNSTNSFEAHGGGIYSSEGSISLIDSRVSDNAVSEMIFGGSGGGIFAGSGDVSLTRSDVNGNVSLRSGGGIFSGTGNVSISFSAVSLNAVGGLEANRSDSRGGGVFSSSGRVTVISSGVNENSTFGYESHGGGIYLTTGGLYLVDSVVDRNATHGNRANGGGIGAMQDRFSFAFGRPVVSLVNSVVSNNMTTGFSSDGGGIAIMDGYLELSYSSISGNRTYGDSAAGGGVYARSSNVSLVGSLVHGNSTDGTNADAGGILAFGRSFNEFSLVSTTVSGNSTRGEGSDRGGVLSISNTLIVNSTIAGNASIGEVGGVEVAGELSIFNSIIADNDDNGVAPDLSYSDTSGLRFQNNLIGDTTGSGITPELGGGNILNQPAMLGPLADNGGPTLTHALLPGSPAIDAGSDTLAVNADGVPLATDQRGDGFDRIKFGRVDIGAFESDFDAPPIAPRVLSATINEGGTLARPDLWETLSVVFDIDVSVTAGSLSLVNDSLDGSSVDLTGIGFDYDSTTATATWDFNTLVAPFDPAFYSWRLDAGSIIGEGLSLDGDGVAGDDFVTQHYVAIPGDANLDGVVDVLNDAFILVGSLGSTENLAWTDGNFNDDQFVDVLGDAFILVANLGIDVRVPTAPVVISTTINESGTLARPDLWETLSVVFDIDVSVTADSLSLVNDSLGGSAVDLTGVGFDYDSTKATATWDFTTLVAPFDPAFYMWRLDAGSITGEGLALDGDGDGVAGDDFVAEHYVAIPGDTNLDGVVDVLGDAFALVSNLGSTTNLAWADGNFNGDDAVDVLNDGFLLVSNLGRDVRPPVMPSSSKVVPSGPTASPSSNALALNLAVSGASDAQDEEQPDENSKQTTSPSDRPSLSLAGDNKLRDEVFGNDF